MPTQPAVLGAARLNNVRLGYNPLAAVRAARVRILIAGVLANTRVRRSSLRVHDAINDAPNTCSLVVDGTRPSEGQDLRVYVNSDNPRLLFNGTLQTVDETYEGKPNQLAWACTAVDDLVRLNRLRPFGTWTNVSATVVAQEAFAASAPGFTTVHVEAGLPAVSIIADGTETFSGFLARLANAVGGYFYVEDLDLHLFLEEATDVPDDIDHTPGRFLNDPPITVRTDDSQLRTRVYGKGYGENVPSDVAAGDTIIPIQDGVQFNPLGGQAIVGTTADGAQSQIVDYTGVALAVGGTLVGPGVAPANAPTVALAAGAGVDSGAHDVAIAFQTAAGISLPGPRVAINVGTVAAPSSTATAGTPSSGGLMNAGTHKYYPVFRTAAGSTTAGPVSNSVTTAPQESAPTTIGTATNGAAADLDATAVYSWKYTFYRSSDGAETTPSPASNTITTGSGGGSGLVSLVGVQAPPSGFTRRWYRTEGGGSVYKLIASPFEEPINNRLVDESADSSLGATAPTVNTTGNGTVAVTGIPVYPSALVTHVDLYREFNNAGASTAKLAFSVTNGTTSAVDALANSSLGATVPSSNTAVANQIALTGVALGGTGTTDRLVYMTVANDPGGTLKLALTIADNTTTTGTLTASDATLTGAAAAPASDTSGLTQPPGQVNAGSTTVLVASAAPFSATGGWVILSGGQVARYASFSGQTLIGIPASGVGAITTTVLYGSQALPAPALLGVTGLTLPMQKGAAVHIWVQRDDLSAQAALIALDAAQGRVSTGVVEHVITDMRRGEASLIALCDADLERYSRPIVTVTFDARDLDLKAGKPVTFNLTSPAISTTLTLMTVDISEIDIVPNGLAPRFHCVASSVSVSLESVLRKLLTKAA
jgi:hypothetical protein